MHRKQRPNKGPNLPPRERALSWLLHRKQIDLESQAQAQSRAQDRPLPGVVFSWDQAWGFAPPRDLPTREALRRLLRSTKIAR